MTTDTLTRPALGLWRSLRLLYLRWWLACIEAEHRAYAREPDAIPAQLEVFRHTAQAVRVRILTMENEQ